MNDQLFSSSHTSSPFGRILLCDDDPRRAQVIAQELAQLSPGTTTEIVSPRSSFAPAVLSGPVKSTTENVTIPRFPVMIFFINVGQMDVESSSICGSVESERNLPDPSTFQFFQVCHISCDYLVAADTLNIVRYVFTMSSAALEIALCILDTATKYSTISKISTSKTERPSTSDGRVTSKKFCSSTSSPVQSIDSAASLAFKTFLQSSAVTPPSLLPSLSQPKVCVSRCSTSILPRIRQVNEDFERCFGHPASWIRGRSITVLGGLLTEPHMLLNLCKNVDGSLRKTSNQDNDANFHHDVTLYSSNGAAIAVNVRVSVLFNCSRDNSIDSVAVLAFRVASFN